MALKIWTSLLQQLTLTVTEALTVSSVFNLDPEDANKKTLTGLVDGMYICLPEELNIIS